MTTSGTSSYNAAITQMITTMYRRIGAIAEDEQPTAGMYNDALFAGNALIKEWQALGIHVWTEEEAILFFQAGQNRYLLGGANSQGVQGPYGPDNCCDAYSWVPMQVAIPVSGGDTTVTVTNTVAPNGVAVLSGDNFGIVLDSGVAFWTTVNGTPVGNVVTLTNPIPAGQSASAQNNAFDYTTKIVRPLQVPFARQIYYQGGQSQGPRLTPMTVLSRKEYMDLPNPFDPGISTQFFYSPQLVSGVFYPWPNPQDANFGARLTWYRPLMDLTSPANTADIPQEWLNGLMWNLALEMAPEFDIPPQRWEMIAKMAAIKLDLIQSYDREPEPILFGMDYDQTRR